jgi:hypothetical protein
VDGECGIDDDWGRVMTDSDQDFYKQMMWRTCMVPVVLDSRHLIRPYTGFEDPPSMYERLYTAVWRAWLKKKKLAALS